MKAQISQERFRDLVVELIDENPFAIRPVLKILDVVFTDSVPTLAVTCEDRPVLKVNLDFLRAHCLTDEHVKAVVCHEFLHVVLRHTEIGSGPFTAARHLALDAAINAIIHRQFGDAYSSMMKTYYRDAQDLKKMLRPMNRDENAWWTHYQVAWKGASAMGARLGRPLRREARRRRHRGGRGGPEGTGRSLAARLPLRAVRRGSGTCSATTRGSSGSSPRH